MPYGREILLRNVKYTFAACEIYFISLDALASNFTIYEVNYFTSTKLIFHKKSRGLKYNDFCFGKSLVSRSGENNAERAAAIPNIVDTPTDIAFVWIIPWNLFKSNIL